MMPNHWADPGPDGESIESRVARMLPTITAVVSVAVDGDHLAILDLMRAVEDEQDREVVAFGAITALAGARRKAASSAEAEVEQGLEQLRRDGYL